MLFVPESAEMSNIHIGQPWRQCAAPTEFRQGGWRRRPSQTPTQTSPINRNRRPPPFFLFIFFFKAQLLTGGKTFHCDSVHREHAFARWMWMACVCLESKERLRTWRGTRIPHPFIILLVCLGAAPGMVSRHFSATTTPASYKFKAARVLLSFLFFFLNLLSYSKIHFQSKLVFNDSNFTWTLIVLVMYTNCCISYTVHLIRMQIPSI